MVTLRDAERLVGLPYVDGHFDCMHLTLRAARELFGRQVPWADQAHPRGGARQTAVMRAQAGNLARPLAPRELPEPGDLAHYSRAVTGSSVRHWHVGTVLLHEGRAWVLHTSQALGSSVLQPIDEVQGMTFEGFYRWLT